MKFYRWRGFSFGIAADHYPTWVFTFGPKGWFTVVHQAHYALYIGGWILSRNGLSRSAS